MAVEMVVANGSCFLFFGSRGGTEPGALDFRPNGNSLRYQLGDVRIPLCEREEDGVLAMAA
jgi:hypothetical protein